MLDWLFTADFCLLRERGRGGGGGRQANKSLGEKRKSSRFYLGDCSIFGASIAHKDWPYHAMAKSQQLAAGSVCVCVCVCVCVRERERECVGV